MIFYKEWSCAMKILNKVQKEFFHMLKEIQEEVVIISLGEIDQGNEIEEVIYDSTYEMSYRIMELLEGYMREDLKFKIIDEKSEVCLGQDIQLHDVCADYLKHI